VPGHQPGGQPGVLLHPGDGSPLGGQPRSEHREGPGERTGGKGAGRAAVVWKEVGGLEFIIGRDCLADHSLVEHV